MIIVMIAILASQYLTKNVKNTYLTTDKSEIHMAARFLTFTLICQNKLRCAINSNLSKTDHVFGLMEKTLK